MIRLKHALAAATIGAATLALAHDNVHDPNVQARMDAMTAIASGTNELGEMARGIKPLQAVVMVAPLLGLLGTVYGMIASFQSISLNSGGNVKEDLSSGIYEALVTTATGLTIAIPFLFLYLWLNRRADQVGENINQQARQFLGGFFPVGTNPATGDQGGTETAAAAETQTT